MFPKIDPNTTEAWKKLERHFEVMEPVHLRELFAADDARFEKFHLRFNDLLLDYSKNRITEETMAYLVELAKEKSLKS